MMFAALACKVALFFHEFKPQDSRALNQKNWR